MKKRDRALSARGLIRENLARSAVGCERLAAASAPWVVLRAIDRQSIWGKAMTARQTSTWRAGLGITEQPAIARDVQSLTILCVTR